MTQQTAAVIGAGMFMLCSIRTLPAPATGLANLG